MDWWKGQHVVSVKRSIFLTQVRLSTSLSLGIARLRTPKRRIVVVKFGFWKSISSLSLSLSLSIYLSIYLSQQHTHTYIHTYTHTHTHNWINVSIAQNKQTVVERRRRWSRSWIRRTSAICWRKDLGNVVFELSTRTRCSFEAAMKRLGGDDQRSASRSSSKKGETLQDTMRCLACYTDSIVPRHPMRLGCVGFKVSGRSFVERRRRSWRASDAGTVGFVHDFLWTQGISWRCTRCVGRWLEVRTYGTFVGASFESILGCSLELRRTRCPAGARLHREGCEWRENVFLLRQVRSRDTDKAFSLTTYSTQWMYVRDTHSKRAFRETRGVRKVQGFVHYFQRDLAKDEEICRRHAPLPRVGEILEEIDPTSAALPSNGNGMFTRMALLALVNAVFLNKQKKNSYLIEFSRRITQI